MSNSESSRHGHNKAVCKWNPIDDLLAHVSRIKLLYTHAFWKTHRKMNIPLKKFEDDILDSNLDVIDSAQNLQDQTAARFF